VNQPRRKPTVTHHSEGKLRRARPGAHRCSSLPRFAIITAQEKELSGDAPPAREVIAPAVHRRSSLGGAGPHSRILRIGSPRFVIATVLEVHRNGCTPRGPAHRCSSLGGLALAKAAKGDEFCFDDVSGKMNLVLHSRSSAPGPARRSRGGAESPAVGLLSHFWCQFMRVICILVV
jgi:hypothetical protein